MTNEVMGKSSELQLKERVTETEKPQCRAFHPIIEKYSDQMGFIIAVIMGSSLIAIALILNYLFIRK